VHELLSYVFSPLREGDRLWKARPRVAYGLIAAGFGVSMVTESDIGANFSGAYLSRTPSR
jgi:hypothetical protein